MQRWHHPFRQAKSISIRRRLLYSFRLWLAERYRPLHRGMRTRTPRASRSSCSQSALATALEPMADNGSMPLVARRPFGARPPSEEIQGILGVARLSREQAQVSGRPRPVSHNRRLYKKRCRNENVFARLKNWRAITMRYTRCGALFLSAIALAAAVIL